MVHTLKTQDLRRDAALTHNGAGAYDLSQEQPLTHLTFTLGAALLQDGYYQNQQAELQRLVQALLGAWRAEPRFAWQYGAWMRDPRRGKGNRIQGAVVPALLDALVESTAYNEVYVAACLGHRVDDLMTFVEAYRQLNLGQPSAAARRGMALALCGYDEYQLMKYAGRGRQVRLCDVIYMVRAELEALGARGQLALRVGRYLHAPTRQRAEHLEGLPLTQARRELFAQPRDYALDPGFAEHVRRARVTWEQVLGHFGAKLASIEEEARRAYAQRRNKEVWEALLAVPGLLPDMAFLRNLRNMSQAGLDHGRLAAMAAERPFRGIWPHQIFAGSRAVKGMDRVFEASMSQAVAALPPGRHLGIGDASGSMSVRVGGLKGTTTAMDVAFCLVGLMSLTSDLGASFSDASWSKYYPTLAMVRRPQHEGPLAFARRSELRRGMGGTQVFGAIMELIEWLRGHPQVEPPDCLWFFSDMQFDPAGGAADQVPARLRKKALVWGLGRNAPPLELALRLYRQAIGPVDVVLWNLAAYAPAPVPSDTEGVLLVSGFDTNTFAQVKAWREGKAPGQAPVAQSQEVILDHIRSY